MNILLHICCSNCALYPVKIIREEGHNFTGFWFNPNIQPYQEYELRLNSLKDLSDRWRIDMIYDEEIMQNPPLPAIAKGGPGGFIDDNHNVDSRDGCPTTTTNSAPTSVGQASRLLERVFTGAIPRRLGIESQRPERCKSCYRLRLGKTAEEAQRQGFDAFSTTLLISPYQDFEQIVSIGSEFAGRYNVLFYLSDFRQYFREAMALARGLGLYRQKYCGCIYSRKERFDQIQKSKCKM